MNEELLNRSGLALRRKEHAEADPAEVEAFLDQMSFGYLGTHSETPFPNIVPLNFVWFRNALYFHSSRLGQKIKELRTNNKVTFCVADEVALIPSYFTSEKLACPATAFFKSVIVYGEAQFVEDSGEKIAALSAFMQKLQPDGGYEPFSLDDAEYRRQVKSVMVTKIVPEAISAKFKFGQNRTEEEWIKVRDGLLQRNRLKDAEAVDAMEKRCPFH